MDTEELMTDEFQQELAEEHAQELADEKRRELEEDGEDTYKARQEICEAVESREQAPKGWNE